MHIDVIYPIHLYFFIWKRVHFKTKADYVNPKPSVHEYMFEIYYHKMGSNSLVSFV